MDMSKMQGPGGTTGPTPLDLDALLAGGAPGPNSAPSMGFTTPSQPQMSPQGTLTPPHLAQCDVHVVMIRLIMCTLYTRCDHAHMPDDVNTTCCCF